MILDFENALGRSGRVDFTKPVHARGRSGAGKSLLIDVFLFAIGNLERSGSNCRPLSLNSEPFTATLSEGDVSVKRSQTGSTWKAARLLVTGPRRLASQAETYEALAPMLGCPDLRVAAFIANPFEWARFAAGEGGGEPLRNFLFKHIASAKVDIYDGLLTSDETRDEKTAYKACTDTRKQRDIAAGVLEGALQAQRDLGARPYEPDADDIAEARAAVDGAAEASAAFARYDASRSAHMAWRRRKDDFDLRHAQWRTVEPEDAGAEPPTFDSAGLREKQRRLSALREQADVHRSALSRAQNSVAMADKRINSLREMLNRTGAPDCASRFAACQHAIARKQEVEAADEEMRSLHESLAEHRATIEQAQASLDALRTEGLTLKAEVESAESSEEAVSRDRLVWQQRKDRKDQWLRTEPRFSEPEPEVGQPVEPPPDISFYTDALSRYATATEKVARWDDDKVKLEQRVAAAKANYDAANVKVARAEFVLTTLRERPGQYLTEFLGKLDLGPVTLRPTERGIDVLYDGVAHENLSDGQIVATSLWLRTAVARYLGIFKVPIFVDNVQDCVGLPLPDLSDFRPVYLHTEDCDLTVGAA